MAEMHAGHTGPDLTRSLYVLTDEDGKVLGDFLKVGRAGGWNAGRSRHCPQPQLVDLAAFLRMRAAEGSGRPAMNPADIVVGDAAAGQSVLQRRRRLQQVSFAGRRSQGRRRQVQPGRPAGPDDQSARRDRWPARRPASPSCSVQVKVTLAPGRVISGTLVSVDDFFVTLIDTAGDRRTIERPIGSDFPKVEINDPLEAHRQLMLKYTDEAMHNLVAYLVTLK